MSPPPPPTPLLLLGVSAMEVNSSAREYDPRPGVLGVAEA